MSEPRYLLVRPEDLVILGAAWTGCTVEGTTLRASGPDPVLLVTFPPQAVAESKERGGGGVLRGRLSGPGTVALALDDGAAVPLTVEGLLGAVASARIAGGAVEIPFGLTLDPARIAADARVRHAGPPRVSPDGGHAVWQTRVVSDGPMTYAAAPVGRDDSDLDVAPLSAGDRGQIAALGPARLDRLALSPLGGTLSAHLRNETFEWDHDMALGRDRRVRVLRHGMLYPYGHRAVFEEVAERTVEGGVAALRVRSVLTVTEPVRAMPDDGTAASRTFPFHEVELLTTTVEGLVAGWSTFQPPSERTLGVRAELAAAQARTAEAQTAFDAWTPALTIDDLVARGDQHATDLRDRIGVEIARLQAELDAAIAAAGPDPGPGPGTSEPPLQTLSPEEGAGFVTSSPSGPPPTESSGGVSAAVLSALHQQIRNLESQAVPLQAHVDAQIAHGHALAALGRDPVALAQHGVFEAQVLLQVRAEEEPIRARIAELERTVNLLFVPKRGDVPVPFRVRCAGVVGDVTFETPVVFVSDFTLPPEGDFFAGYRSLSDPALPALVAEALAAPFDAALPGARVDVVRSAAPTTADVQQVHALRLRAEQRGADVRPVVDELTVELPELRALLPDLPARVPVRYTDVFRDGGGTDTVLAFVATVPVTFDGRAERGGGVLTPSFDADAISRTFGPVDRRALEGGAAAAFAKMRLLGVQLSALLPEGAPPEIMQLLPPGGPAGVRMSWTGRRLRSHGAFRAHRPDDELDTTTLDLVVEQSGERRVTRCALDAFTLSLPTPETELLALAFGGLVFTQADGQAPKVEVSTPDIRFSGALTLLQGLRDAIDLGSTLPALRSVPDGVTVTYALHVPDAPAGVFMLRNIAVRASVDVPFRGGQPSVALAFASKADPFHLQVSLFGGGGYIDVVLDAGGVRRFEASLDFGAVVAVDFGIVSAEVHALGGVIFAIEGDRAEATAFLRIGGSVELFGLVSVSVELVVELRFESEPRPRLVGRATLVVEVDLTLYADSVELDSGEWEFVGGSGPAVPPAPADEPTGAADWQRYQEAYA